MDITVEKKNIRAVAPVSKCTKNTKKDTFLLVCDK